MKTIKEWVTVIFSALFEKDKHKTEDFDVPFILSMSRLAIIAMLVVWSIVVLGTPALLAEWPVATLGAVLVFALPIAGALKSTKPEQVLEWAKGIVDRLGEG